MKVTYDDQVADVRKRLHALADESGVGDVSMHKLIDDYMDEAAEAEDEISMAAPIEERVMDMLYTKHICGA